MTQYVCSEFFRTKYDPYVHYEDYDQMKADHQAEFDALCGNRGLFIKGYVLVSVATNQITQGESDANCPMKCWNDAWDEHCEAVNLKSDDQYLCERN